MANSPILHVRIDDLMLAQIDQLAAGEKVDRSTMVRTLLSLGLEDPKRVIVAREILMILSSERKKILSAFNDRLQSVVEDLKRDVERRT